MFILCVANKKSTCNMQEDLLFKTMPPPPPPLNSYLIKLHFARRLIATFFVMLESLSGNYTKSLYKQISKILTGFALIPL